MNENVVLIAGTLVEQYDATQSRWIHVPRLTAIGATGEMSEAKEKTTLEDKIRKYGSGLRDAPDKNLTGQYVPPQSTNGKYQLERVDQQAFITRARNEDEMPLRITFPDLERCQIDLKTLGYQIDEGTQEDWKMFTVNGKQNSRPTWTEAPEMTGVDVTGPTTVAAAATITLIAITVPADAYYCPGTTFESDDESIATVDQAGVVTGVLAGTANITVTLNGFDTVVAITVT